jgi:PGF-pre-PGF domain-containing protein
VDNGDTIFKQSTVEWVWKDNFTSGDNLELVYKVTVPAGSSPGTYSIDGVASYLDANGDNINNLPIAGSSDIKVTAASSASSSGGSSGGGTGTSGEAYSNILTKEVKSLFITRDSEIRYEFTEESNAIDFVEFKSLKNPNSYISATVEMLKDKSAFAGAEAPGEIYHYMNIWVGKAGFATADNIANPVVGFNVRKDWLVNNYLDSGNIRLYRYSDDMWNELDTSVVGEDKQFIYFEAATPGFSPFAISTSSTVVSAESNPIPNSNTEVNNASDSSSDSENGTTQDTDRTPGMGMITGLLSLTLAGLFVRGKNRD